MSVPVGDPVDRDTVTYFLLHLVQFQAQMANREAAFLRGSVFLSDHFEDKSTLFGPALIGAVELEDTVALWPRIVLDPKLSKLVDHFLSQLDPEQREGQAVQDLIRRDYDGLTYVNYLGHYLKHYHDWKVEDESEPKTEEAKKFAQKHASDIVNGAGGSWSELEVYTKYLWLATYHNRVMEELEWHASKVDMSKLYSRL